MIYPLDDLSPQLEAQVLKLIDDYKVQETRPPPVQFISKRSPFKVMTILPEVHMQVIGLAVVAKELSHTTNITFFINELLL